MLARFPGEVRCSGIRLDGNCRYSGEFELVVRDEVKHVACTYHLVHISRLMLGQGDVAQMRRVRFPRSQD